MARCDDYNRTTYYNVMVLRLDPQPLIVMGQLCNWEGTSHFSFRKKKTQTNGIYYCRITCSMTPNSNNNETNGELTYSIGIL